MHMNITLLFRCAHNIVIISIIVINISMVYRGALFQYRPTLLLTYEIYKAANSSHLFY